MSIDPDPAGADAAALVADLRGAARRADTRLRGAIADYALPAEARLDDRLRSRIDAVVAATVSAIAYDLSRHAEKLLDGTGAVVADVPAVTARLGRAGVFRDPGLMDELLADARLALLGAALPAEGEPGRPSLLVRLTDDRDRVVAQAARALLVADSAEDGAPPLPAALHAPLVWAIAAALGSDQAPLDRALVEAALRNIAAHDEANRPTTLATRLALAIDARPDEVAALLLDALGDRRPALFVALLAHAVKLGVGDVRAMLVDDSGERLWVALRAAAIEREAIARIAWALAEAEPRRDIDGFAARLDAIAAIPVADARAALAPLMLHADYRRAVAALGRS